MSGGHQMMLAPGGGGSSGPSVEITDHLIEDYNSGDTAVASYSVNSDGTVRDHNVTTLETWLQSGAAGDYEVQCTASGIITGSPTGTWLPLSSTRSWSCTATAGQYKSATLNIKIRRASDGVELDAATISLVADATV